MKPSFKLLESFEIDPEMGFLPSKPPVRSLSGPWEEWETAAKALPDWLNADGNLARQKLAALAVLDTEDLIKRADQERAMLLLATFGHAYVFATDAPSQLIPKSIAVPWMALSKKLDRPPALAHASLVLQNWKLIDPQDGFSLRNLAINQPFRGGLDESSFILGTVWIEYLGARIPGLLLEAHDAIQKDEPEKVLDYIQDISKQVGKMHHAFDYFYQKCHPDTFFIRYRPFLASLNQVQFEGCGPERHHYSGGSAAQSSLIQAIDLGMGIVHEDPKGKAFLYDMRRYMPPKHRQFLNYLDQNQLIKPYCIHRPKLVAVYQHCVEALRTFRTEHLKLVARYIIEPAKRFSAETTGTGGTNPLIFLKKVRNETR